MGVAAARGDGSNWAPTPVPRSCTAPATPWRRDEPTLLEVMGAECGKVIEQGDPEVSEVIDFAHYYAERGRELEHVAGAAFIPARLTVVTPPWNFPVAIPGGSVLAALASGSPVIIKPASQARRCGAVLVEALWDAGVPRDVLQYVQLEDHALGRELISDPRRRAGDSHRRLRDSRTVPLFPGRPATAG